MSALTLSRQQLAATAAAPLRLGRITELVGLHLLVVGLDAAVGDLVEVTGRDTQSALAEVAASGPRGLVCLPLAHTTGLQVGDLVRHTGGPLQIPVGEALRGRVLDGLGRPIDGGPSLASLPRVSVENAAPGALDRPRIQHQLGLGVRDLF